MAVETKVGLLVGLAFIVCFAVILSNRGSGDVASTQMAYHLLSRHAADDGVQPKEDVTRSPKRRTPRRDADRSVTMPRASRPRANATTPSESASTGRATQGRRTLPRPRTTTPQDRHQPHRRSATMSATQRRDRTNESQRTRPQQTRQSGSARPMANQSNSFDAIFGEKKSEQGSQNRRPSNAKPSRRQQDPQGAASKPLPKPIAKPTQRPQRQSTPTSNLLPPTPRPRKSIEPKRKTALVKYEVKKSDTLWKIARQAYGDASPAIVNAIFEANKSVMKSKDHLVVGKTLTLPTVDGHAPKARPSTKHASEKKSNTRPKAKQKPAIRYYQIKKGDRYTSIAEKLLGDKNRWKEIYELNKDIFPSASDIRYGVRIRIPANDRTLASTR